MARKNQKTKAQINKQLWDKANNTHRVRWQSLSQKSYDFYLNEQLTRDERENLEEAGMPTFVINRVTPIVEIMKYFVTANNPRWKAVGVTGDDVDLAQIHSDISDYCWHASNGKSIYSQVVVDALTKGVGYFLIDVDRDADRGRGEVVFKRLEPYDIFVDPKSSDFLFRDASFISIRKNMSRTQLSNLLPQYASKIKKVNKSGAESNAYSQVDKEDASSVLPEDITMGITLDAEDDDIVAFYEVYKKKKFAFWNLAIRTIPTEDELNQAKQMISDQVQEFSMEVMVKLEERKLEIQQALQSGQIIESRAQLEMQKAEKESQQAIQMFEQQTTEGVMASIAKIEQQVVSDEEYKILIKNEEIVKRIVDAVKFYENRVEVTCSAGDDIFLYEYILPYDEYPIVPICYTHTGTPYPMSAVTPMIGKQQEINKSHQIMLHNANLASNLRWMYEEGSVPEEEWEQYSSSPGALLKYRQGFTPPTPVMPAPINNAFFSIVQQGKSDAEYIAGVPSAMMGFTQEQPETYRGLLANDEFGTRRLRSWMSIIVEPALEHLGRIFKTISQSHYTIEKVFRIVQPDMGEGGDSLNERESSVNIPIYNDLGEQIGKFKDYASAKFDIRIVAGTTMPVNRWALIEEYFRWFQAGLIDDIAMIAETDIRGKKNIVKRKSMYSQMQGQLQQMEEAIKDKDGTIETLERQLVQAGIKMKIGEASNEIRKDVLETEAQQKLLRNTMKEEVKTAKKDMVRAVKSAEDSYKTELKGKSKSVEK